MRAPPLLCLGPLLTLLLTRLRVPMQLRRLTGSFVVRWSCSLAVEDHSRSSELFCCPVAGGRWTLQFRSPSFCGCAVGSKRSTESRRRERTNTSGC